MSDRRRLNRLVEQDRTLEQALRSGRLNPRELLEMIGERRRRVTTWRRDVRRSMRPTGQTTFPIPPGEDPPPPSDGGEVGEFATLPRATVDVTMPIVTGDTFAIASGDVAGLRSALQNCTYGDVIELEAGGTWGITGQNPLAFTTKAGWVEGARVLMRPSNWASLAAAHALASDGMPANLNLVNPRMTPSRAAALGTPILRATSQNIGSMKMSPESRGLYVWGIQFDMDPAYSLTPFESYWIFGADLNDLSGLGDIDRIPYDCVLNQCIVRSYVGAKCRKAASMNIEHHAVVNSYLECHSTEFVEACPLWVAYGRGPYRWENNACVGAGILGFQGGIDLPSWHVNELPRDSTVRHNFFHHPEIFNWQSPNTVLTIRENMKNSWEWKNGEYVLFEHNLLDGSWDGGQNGQGITIKTLNQGTHMDWCATTNLTLRYNKQINTGSGWDILGNQQTGGATEQLGVQVSRLHAHNNLTIIANPYDGLWTGPGRFGLWSAFPKSDVRSGDVDPSWVFEHNTWISLQNKPGGIAGNNWFPIGFLYQGNWSGAYPVHRNSIFCKTPWKFLNKDGAGTPEAILNLLAPGSVFDNNAFGMPSSGGNEFGTYEGNNHFGASDAALGLNTADGTLEADSPCRSGGPFQSTSGSDLGADITTIEAALVNVDLWE